MFLLEPSSDPRIENQAITRVHRHGQTRPCFVYRFIAEETVEPGLLALQTSAAYDSAQAKDFREALSAREVFQLLGVELPGTEREARGKGRVEAPAAAVMDKVARASQSTVGLEEPPTARAVMDL